MHALCLDHHTETLIVIADPLCWDTLQCRTRQKVLSRIRHFKEMSIRSVCQLILFIYIFVLAQVKFFFSNILRKP